MPWLTHLRSAPISARLGLAIILAYALVALFAPWLAPFSEADAVGAQYAPWAAPHYLGTDALGRDVLSRMIWGARNTVGIALVTTALAFLLGTTAGLMAATLVDAKKKHRAVVRADGALALGDIVGSIHKIGALTQGLPACNGWTFWHVERAGGLVCIDEMRASMRAAMKQAAE